jgi:hypothetical protein
MDMMKEGESFDIREAKGRFVYNGHGNFTISGNTNSRM